MVAHVIPTCPNLPPIPAPDPPLAMPSDPTLRDDTVVHLCADKQRAPGGDTDVCVLAAVPGAVDLGYRTMRVQGAACSSSDENRATVIERYGNRYRPHVEIGTAAEVADLWQMACADRARWT